MNRVRNLKMGRCVPPTKRVFQFGYALLLLGCLGPVGEAATLTLRFSNGADDFGWGALAAATRATAQADVTQAATIWQQAIPSTNARNTFTLNIDVKWKPLPSDICGQGGVDAVNGGGTRPTNGTVTLNSNGNWFFDLTPAASEEYFSTNEKWRGQANPTPPALAKDKTDLLTCAEHEFGHTLGYYYDNAVGGLFQPYKNELDANKAGAGGKYGIKTVDNPNDLLLTGQDPTNINSVSHWDPNAGNVPGSTYPLADLLMSRDNVPGDGDSRKFPSPYDISALAKVLGLNQGDYTLDVAQPFPDLIVPEPSTFALAALGAVCLVGRLRRRRPAAE